VSERRIESRIGGTNDEMRLDANDGFGDSLESDAPRLKACESRGDAIVIEGEEYDAIVNSDLTASKMELGDKSRRMTLAH
jgi:hypothetical protein